MRPLVLAGSFTGNLLVAILGSTALESPISLVLKFLTHSFASFVAREWICSILFAFLLGYFIQAIWRSRTAQWIWIVPLVWLFYGLTGIHYDTGAPWLTFSGIACAKGYRHYCQQFWIFSVPLIRSSIYSYAAYRASTASAEHPLYGGLRGIFELMPKLEKQAPVRSAGAKGEAP